MLIHHLLERTRRGRIAAIRRKLTMRNGQLVSSNLVIPNQSDMKVLWMILTSYVDPSYLWQNYYDSSGDDVEWAYTDNFGNNVIETQPGNGDGSGLYPGYTFVHR